MAIYALITGGYVTNVIVADANFIASNHGLVYDAAIDIDAVSPQPMVGWTYNGTTFTDARPQPTSQQIVLASLAAATAFGMNIINNYKVQNVLGGITQAGETQAISDVLANLNYYLGTGSLYAAISEIGELRANVLLPTWAPWITDALLHSALNQIQTYLEIPLT